MQAGRRGDLRLKSVLGVCALYGLSLAPAAAWAQVHAPPAPRQGVPIEAAPVLRVGRVAVHERGQRPLTLVVDGVECGTTPWEGVLEEGPHQAYAYSTQAALATPVVGFTITAGAAAEVELVAVPRAPAALAPAPPSPAAAPPRGAARRAPKADGSEAEADRPQIGAYGGFAVQLLLEPSGTHSDICATSGVSDCTTSAPIGGGLFAYAGYMVDPVGIDAMVGLQVDGAGAKGKVLGMAASLTIPRVGGVFAVRARLAWRGPSFGASLAAGVGAAVRDVIFIALSVDSKTYVAPGIVLDGALHARFGHGTALSFGLMLWGENAGSNFTQKVNPLTTPVHVVSSTQFYALPYVGIEFGP
jgi:hypothetical protein